MYHSLWHSLKSLSEANSTLFLAPLCRVASLQLRGDCVPVCLLVGFAVLAHEPFPNLYEVSKDKERGVGELGIQSVLFCSCHSTKPNMIEILAFRWSAVLWREHFSSVGSNWEKKTQMTDYVWNAYLFWSAEWDIKILHAIGESQGEIVVSRGSFRSTGWHGGRALKTFYILSQQKKVILSKKCIF